MESVSLGSFVGETTVSYHLADVDQVQVKNNNNEKHIFNLITAIKNTRFPSEISFSNVFCLLPLFSIHFNTADKKSGFDIIKKERGSR